MHGKDWLNVSAFAFFFKLLCLTVHAQGSVTLDLSLRSYSNSLGGVGYFAEAYLLGSVSQHVAVESPGKDVVAHANPPSGAFDLQGSWGSFPQMTSSLNGVWTLRDRAGTAEERVYTFAVELDLQGGLANGVPLTTITQPQHLGSLPYDNPTFVWQGPQDFDRQFVNLYEESPAFRLIASDTFQEGTTGSWTPGVTLEPNASYRFDLWRSKEVNLFQSVGIPIDDKGVQWPHFLFTSSSSVLASTSEAAFTAIPEAGPMVTGMAVLLWAAFHRYRPNSPRTFNHSSLQAAVRVCSRLTRE